MNPEKFGLTADDVEKQKEIPPTVELSSLAPGETLNLRILEKEPRMVKTKNEKGRNQENYVITVLDLKTNIKMSLWLSAMTVRMGMYSISQKRGNLENAEVVIGCRMYDHETYGRTKAYTVSMVDDKMNNKKA